MADRYEYNKGRLQESEVSPNPHEQFAHWLQEAIAAKVLEPTAMCLSTVGDDGRPSSRIVLLRGHDDRGLTFFTNYESRKGLEIGHHPFGCVNFWWGSLERQIRIEGSIEMVFSDESDEYWSSRPFDSQAASAASPQSQVVSSREYLEALVSRQQELHSNQIPRPSHWGGFRLIPEYFEFWQGGPARLHDRIAYTLLEEGTWHMDRLAP